MKYLFRLIIRLIILLVVVICVLGVAVFFLNNQQSSESVITINTPEVTATPQGGERIELVDPPPGFEPRDEYVAPLGTEIEGVGVIDNGFALRGLDKVEFVTGYTVALPENFEVAGYNLLNDPELILGILIMGLKASGMEDQEGLPGVDNIGNESVGITLTTNWYDSKLRIDAVIFRRSRTGVLAAVIYADGNTPSVSVIDIATQMDEKIQNQQEK